MSGKRRIFNNDNLAETKIVSSLADKSNLYPNSISACGCLIYKKTKGTSLVQPSDPEASGKLQLLLISYADPKWNKLDDFGGQVDENDETVDDTIARETSEETNGVINEEFITEQFENDDNYNVFYNAKSKYYVAVLEVGNDFYPDTSVFGTLEETDKINRTIGWYDYLTVKNKMAVRLTSNIDLMTFLDELV